MMAGRSMIGAAVGLAMAAMGTGATAQTSNAPVELTTELLDHWVQAMRQIGAANLEAAPPNPLTQTDPAKLDDICAKSGFVSAEECGCTVLYVAVLLNGFDKDAQSFADPARAIENRLIATVKRTDLSAADMQASLTRDRRMLFTLRKAFPGGAPPEYLKILGDFLRTHVGQDAEPWRELGAGAKALETRAIGNRCNKLQALTSPEK
jgi:hypothetical protein